MTSLTTSDSRAPLLAALPVAAPAPVAPLRTPPSLTAPIPLCAPEVSGREWEYVKECLDTGWVSSVGSYVDRFEQEFAARVGTRHAVATASGTAALHVALLAAGVQPDDEVLVSTLTFIAPANAVRYVGAWPLFVDAEPAYWQMDPARVGDFLRHDCRRAGGELRNRRTGRRVRAILPVHVLGHPVDLAPILALAREYGLRVIEDASESLGGRYHDAPLGSLGDLACFSFNGNKLLTTGGGGMLVTDDARLAAHARHLSTQAKAEPVEYVHDVVGFNYRLTNVQAAMGVAQLERLDEFLATKRRIADGYAAGLADVPGLTVMPEAPWARAAYWLYTVLVDEEQAGGTARALLAALGARAIQTRPLWQPLHRSPAHAAAPPAHCPTADRLYRDALSLPCSVGLAPAQQAVVIDTIRTILAEWRAPRAAASVTAPVEAT